MNTVKRFTKFLLLALASLTLLSACGGGGGGGNSNVPTYPNSNGSGDWLVITPSNVDVTATEGVSSTFSVTGKSTRLFSQQTNIGIIDLAGVVTPNASITPITQTEYRITFKTNPDLKPGVHTSNVEVRLCEDSPAICSKPLPGSPWIVPFKVTVTPAPSRPVSLTFNPSYLNVLGSEGSFTTVKLNVSLGSELSGVAYLRVTDSSNILSGMKNLSMQVAAYNSYSLNLFADSNLKAQNYSGRLEFSLCKEDTPICKSPIAISPATLPYTLTIARAQNSTPTLRFSPGSLTGTGGEGAGIPLDFTIQSGSDLVAPVNLAVIDKNNLMTVFQGSVGTIGANQSYAVKAVTKSELRPGTFSGSLEIRLCKDSALVCTQPIMGSPWIVPYNFDVKSKIAGISVNFESNPNPLEIVYYEGETKPFKITASTTSALTGVLSLNLGVIDPSRNVSVKNVSNESVERAVATLEPSSVLKSGTYTSTLELRACADNTVDCKSPFSGSPRFLPIKLTVLPTNNLTPLVPLPQGEAWSTHRANAAHNNFINYSFDPKNFSRRWNWIAPNQDRVTRVAIDSGRVYFVKALAGAGDNVHELITLSEQDGKVLWKSALGALPKVNDPAAGLGKVFVTSVGHQGTFFWVFNQIDGSLQNKISMSAQWEAYQAPTIYGNEVFTESGYYGGMSKYSVTEQKMAWSIGLPQYDSWTPAVDASYAYALLEDSLHVINKSDGSIAYKIPLPVYTWRGYTGITPTLSGNGMAFASNHNALTAFDLRRKNVAWSISNSDFSAPAYANDVVYVIRANGTALEARSAQTGNLLWTANAITESNFFGNYQTVLVTANLAFLSSSNRTIAIDLASRKIVWEHPQGGELAISSNGILYIKSTNRIDAINLK